MDVKPPTSRPGGMRISALLNDDDAAPPPAPGKAYEADAASDGTVSERDAEGGVTRGAPPGSHNRPLPPGPSAASFERRTSDVYERGEHRRQQDYHRASTAQPAIGHPYDAQGYYGAPPPPPRSVSSAPALPAAPRDQARPGWEQPPRPHGYDYQRDPYYGQPPHSHSHPSRSYPPPTTHQHPHPPPLPPHQQSHHSMPNRGEHDWRGGHGSVLSEGPIKLAPVHGTHSGHAASVPPPARYGTPPIANGHHPPHPQYLPGHARPEVGHRAST